MPRAPKLRSDVDDVKRLAGIITDVFRAHAYRPIDPPVLQPAELFLDLSGEDIRHRMFMASDPGGAALCLRPELTIPTCRHYLMENPTATKAAKYCYDGIAFRYQGPGSNRPREFHQIGVESIGATRREEADAEVIALAIEACDKAGLKGYDIRIGDVGLFFDLIHALPMAEQWRQRLKRFIWRPTEFHELLDRLVANDGAAPRGPGSGLLKALSKLDEAEARAALGDVLDLAQIAPVGGRTVEEIAERLLRQAAEARADALPRATAKLIDDYLAVTAAPKLALGRLRRLAREARLKLDNSLDRFEKRMACMAKLGVPVDRLVFDADFGRNMEYYTGFVFELTVPRLGDNAQIAGGGRYDRLLSDLGAPKDMPGIGAMIRTERLLMALGQGRRP